MVLATRLKRAIGETPSGLRTFNDPCISKPRRCIGAPQRPKNAVIAAITLVWSASTDIQKGRKGWKRDSVPERQFKFRKKTSSHAPKIHRINSKWAKREGEASKSISSARIRKASTGRDFGRQGVVSVRSNRVYTFKQ